MNNQPKNLKVEIGATTPEELGAIVDPPLSACFAGYVVVGILADTGDPVMCFNHSGNPQIAERLNVLMAGARVGM